MKKKALTLTLAATLILSSLFCGMLVQPVKSQSLGTVYINLDGSITGTEKIQRNGNVYTLTDNLYNLPIVVLCDNIVFDGGGFTLKGPGGYPTPAAINLSSTNVVVRNFTIESWEVGILGSQNNNVITNNNVTDNERDIAVYANNYNITRNYLGAAAYEVRIVGNNNIIFQNIMVNYGFAFWITSSSGNIITANDITSSNPNVFNTDFGGFRVYHNNFINTNPTMGILLADPNATLPPWDNGYPSGGNYWSDYASNYPNATEVDNSGIGNTPYVVSTSPAVVDRCPLLSPVDIPQASFELPLPSSSASPSLTPSPSIPEFPSLLVIAFILIVLALAISVVKRKTQGNYTNILGSK